MTNNTNGNVFAQAGSNIAGCTQTVKVSIFRLPNQVADASTQVSLSNIGPGEDRGDTNINIPGVGNGHLTVTFKGDPGGYYDVQVSELPGQTAPSSSDHIIEYQVCGAGYDEQIVIPGIGNGVVGMRM